MIEIPLQAFLELNRQASVGRLFHGLVHNLNGPLQNFGMDMDMIRYSLDKDDESTGAFFDDLRLRLARMEEEFEKINRIIQNTAGRSSLDEESAYLGLGDFLEQEIEFLNANLYFKHHVRSELSFDGALPRLDKLKPGTASGISGFLQVVVEEMERQDMVLLRVEARGDGPGAEVRLFMESGPSSENFLKAFEKVRQGSGRVRIGSGEMEIANAFLCLASAGIEAAVQASSDHTRLTLRLPRE